MPRRTSHELARAISIGCLLLLLTAAVVVLRMATSAPAALVRARFVLFTAYVDSAAFDAPPNALRRRGFLSDDAAETRAFGADLEAIPGWRARLAALRAQPEPLRRAQALTRTFATYGNVGECGAAVRLLDKIRRAGCCSDHAEVFVALSPLVGLTAREVHMAEHTLAELWLPAERRWVLIDPMFGYVVRDGGGRALSLSEVRRVELTHASPVHADAFRPVALTPDRAAFVARAYASAGPFERIAYTNGVDVLREDALRAALQPAPKVVARLVGALLGVTPTYRALVDGANRAHVAWLAAARDLAWTALLLCALGALAWPARALWNAARRRRGAWLAAQHAPRRAPLDARGAVAPPPARVASGG
jgi:transglutaminase-like putative cysteine protease